MVAIDVELHPIRFSDWPPNSESQSEQQQMRTSREIGIAEMRRAMRRQPQLQSSKLLSAPPRALWVNILSLDFISVLSGSSAGVCVCVCVCVGWTSHDDDGDQDDRFAQMSNRHTLARTFAIHFSRFARFVYLKTIWGCTRARPKSDA